MTKEELNLWRRCRKGDEAARKELVFMHIKLVKFLVDRLHRKVNWVDRDVLMNEGIIGLLKAMNRFDYNLGVKFGTYARDDIRGSMLASPEVTRNLPRRQYENSLRIRRAQVELAMRLEHKPTLEEIAGEAGLAVDQVHDALDAWHIAFADSFVDQGGGSDPDPESGQRPTAYAALIVAEPDADKPWDTANDVIRIQAALARLTEREVLVVKGYYWEDETDAQIAKKLGLTLVNTRRIRMRAIEKLRGMLE